MLVAAVVGFAGQNGGVALLGPAAVAFLCGPLDLVHWRQRAFWLMAYNSGNRMIAALVGAIVFDRVARGGVQPGIRFAVAALVASLVFAFVDLVLIVGFEHFRSKQSVLVAVRADLLIDCLTVPLGLFGAGAGAIAVEVGWWAGALVLVPAVFAPELILVRARRALREETTARVLRTVVPTVLTSAAVVVAVVVFAPLPAPSVLVGLVAVAFVAGFELQVEAGAPVPGPGLAALVAAAMVVAGHAALAGAVIVAVTTTATTLVLVRRNGWWGPVLAAGATVAAVVVFDTRPSRAGALAAVLVFELIVVTRLPRILWTTPLVCAAVALAYVWREIGRGGGAVFAVGLVAVGAAAAVWGAPPWGSRVLGPWGARHPTRAHRIIVVTTAAVSLGLGIAAVTTQPSARELLVLGSSAAAAGVATMAMVGVRQWRFAPRGRARDAMLVLVSVVVVVIAYPALTLAGSPWSVAILVTVLAVCVTIGWPLARRADAAAHVPEAPRPEDAPVP